MEHIVELLDSLESGHLMAVFFGAIAASTLLGVGLLILTNEIAHYLAVIFRGWPGEKAKVEDED